MVSTQDFDSCGGGSNPSILVFGSKAHEAEQLAVNQWVVGSNPTAPSIIRREKAPSGVFFSILKEKDDRKEIHYVQ